MMDGLYILCADCDQQLKMIRSEFVGTSVTAIVDACGTCKDAAYEDGYQKGQDDLSCQNVGETTDGR